MQLSLRQTLHVQGEIMPKGEKKKRPKNPSGCWSDSFYIYFFNIRTKLLTATDVRKSPGDWDWGYALGR